MRFTLDVLDGQAPPRPGDILMFMVRRKPSYRVVRDIEPVDSRIWHDRWRLLCDPIDEPPASARIIRTIRYRPGEGPSDFF